MNEPANKTDSNFVAQRKIEISKTQLTLSALAATLVLYVFFKYLCTNLLGMTYSKKELPLIFLIIVLSFPVHELIHALGFRLLGKIPWSQIRFGFEKRLIAFYANPLLPLPRNAYFWSGALPGLTIGLLPLILGFALRSMPLAFAGFVSLASSTGDAFILWSLRKVASHESIYEHREQTVFSIIDNRA
jgi:hypothetical protein